MVSKIRSNNNRESPDVPVDDEAGGVISTIYVWDSGSGEWVPATAAAALSGDLIRLKTADGLTVIDPATDGVLKDVKRALTDFETRLDYDVRVDSNPVYVGKAAQGTATSTASWTVQKLEYDGSDRLTRAQVVSGVAWDDRATSF